MADYPWLAKYPEGIDWHAPLEAKPLHALIEESAERFPDRTHIDFLGKTFSFRDIARDVKRAAIGFQRLGVGRDVRVGLFMPNCPQYLISLYAVSRAGGTVVNFSPLYSTRELAEQVADSGIDIMVTLSLDLTYTKIRDILDDTAIRKLVVGRLPDVLPFPQNLLFPVVKRGQMAKLRWNDKHMAFRDLLVADGTWEDPRINPQTDVVMLQYTGGTTGTPKGAMLTHANLTINTQQSALAFRDLEDGQEVIEGVLPFFHIFALLSVALISAWCGATIVMQPRFRLNAVLDDLTKKGVTLLPAVPTMLTAINHALEEKPRKFRALKLVVSGGAALPAEVMRKFESLTSARVREGYGLTETSPVIALAPPGDLGREGSIGLPLPGTKVFIVDVEDPTREMPKGEPGELAVEGPQVMKGYWRNPEETAAVLRDGRLLTGDMARMDADGFCFIVDRKKETIKVSGYNVFPRNIEEAIYEHPAVAETAVIGVPDDYRGESPKAFVVLKRNKTVTGDELLEFLKSRLGKHEMPSTIAFRDSLPKSPIGKILKKDLIAEEEGR